MEVWKKSKYNETYYVSNEGRIKNNDILLKPTKNSKGYLGVKLYCNGKPKCFRVHRLVWEAFNGEIPDGYEINHINENKEDNRLVNLNLMSHLENIRYGTGIKRSADKRKKSILQLTLDYELVKEWSSAQEAGRNGFDCAHVNECCNGKRKTHKGFRFLFTADADEIIKNKIIDL